MNSIRARMALLTSWLERQRPDVLCLQETKVTDDLFPVETLKELGYESAFAGEKSYNGVAILSRRPLANVRLEYPLAANQDTRLVGGELDGVRVYSAYFPNGRDPLSEHFRLKLQWIDALGELIFGAGPEPLLLLGDFNVAPEPRDVYSPEEMEGRIHFHPDERAALRRLLDRGFMDAFRVANDDGGLFSWWDYRQGAFRRNLGLRIDHVWATPELAKGAVNAFIDVDERRKEGCSDHAPVIVDFA